MRGRHASSVLQRGELGLVDAEAFPGVLGDSRAARRFVLTRIAHGSGWPAVGHALRHRRNSGPCPARRPPVSQIREPDSALHRVERVRTIDKALHRSAGCPPHKRQHHLQRAVGLLAVAGVRHGSVNRQPRPATRASISFISRVQFAVLLATTRTCLTWLDRVSSVPVREVVAHLRRLVGETVEPRFGALPDRKFERVRAADPRPAAAAIGWRPRTSLEEGLARTVDFYRAQLQPMAGRRRPSSR